MIHSDSIAKDNKNFKKFSFKKFFRGSLNWNKTFMNVFLMTVLNEYSAQWELSTHWQNNHPKIVSQHQNAGCYL